MPIPWKVSLHGGHSGEYCAHAKGTLREVVEAAIAADISIFGLSEHCPRYDGNHLFSEERDAGWSWETLVEKFEAYEKAAGAVQDEFAGRIQILKGFETEFGDATYLDKMKAIRESGGYDFIIGSVHTVNGRFIDDTAAAFENAMTKAGGLEQLALDYYASVRTLVTELQPDVVGHLDLVTKIGDEYGPLDTPSITEAVRETLDVIKENGSILDLNVSPLRRGKATPYPAPWIVDIAKELNIPFCFGDDSHGPKTVGVGIEAGRDYLLKHGIKSVTCLTKEQGEVSRVEIGLEG